MRGAAGFRRGGGAVRRLGAAAGHCGGSARRRRGARAFGAAQVSNTREFAQNRTWISSVYSASRDIASQYRKFLFANPA